MNAVNLIPADQRRRGRPSSTSLPFLGLLVGLTIVLLATALFVLAHNRVDSRKSQLAAIQASTARWSQAAGSYANDLTANRERQATINGVESLAGQRADWSELLGQLAAVMPAHSQLSSMTAGTASSTTAGATGSTSTATGSQIQLSACATTQTVVAQTMIALRRVSGVSGVYLGSDGAGGSGGAAGSGGCGYAVSFSISLSFNPPTTSSGSGQTTEPAKVTPASTTGTAGASQ